VHVANHYRDAFVRSIEGEESVAGEFYADKAGARLEAMNADEQLRWLSGQLWNCTDILPAGVCSELDMRQGSTYAQAARLLRRR
jgi:hypothetical protein